MHRLLTITLAIVLSLVGGWAPAAGGAEPSIPQPTEPPTTDPGISLVVADTEPSELDQDDSRVETSVAADQFLQDAAGFENRGFTILRPEGQRQENACAYECVRPTTCPVFVGLPKASCIGGCCVY